MMKERNLKKTERIKNCIFDQDEVVKMPCCTEFIREKLSDMLADKIICRLVETLV